MGTLRYARERLGVVSGLERPARPSSSYVERGDGSRWSFLGDLAGGTRRLLGQPRGRLPLVLPNPRRSGVREIRHRLPPRPNPVELGSGLVGAAFHRRPRRRTAVERRRGYLQDGGTPWGIGDLPTSDTPHLCNMINEDTFSAKTAYNMPKYIT